MNLSNPFRALKSAALLAAITFSIQATALAGGPTPPVPGSGSTNGSSVTGDTYLYTANGDISAYDVNTNAQVNETGDVNGNYAQATTISGGTVYVASQDGNGNTVISSYNTQLQSINANVATFSDVVSNAQTNTLVVSGNTLYAVNADGYINSEVEAINLTDDSVSQFTSTNGETYNAGLISGNTLYVSTYQGGNVQTFDLATGNQTNGNFISLEGGNGTGGQMAVDGSGDLFVVDQNNQTVGKYKLSDGSAVGAGANFITNVNGDGQGFVNIAYEDGAIYIEGLDGNTYEYNATTGSYVGEISGLQSSQGFVGTDYAAIQAAGTPGAAPEPRSWLLGCLVLGSLGLLWQRRLVTE